MRTHPTPLVSRFGVRGLLAVPLLIALAWAAPQVHAQSTQAIQKCRVDGVLVLQNGPCRSGEAELSPQMVAMAKAEPRRIETAADAQQNPGGRKRSLAEIIRARDGSTAPQRTSDEPQSDGSLVLRSRMGAF